MSASVSSITPPTWEEKLKIAIEAQCSFDRMVWFAVAALYPRRDPILTFTFNDLLKKMEDRGWVPLRATGTSGPTMRFTMQRVLSDQVKIKDKRGNHTFGPSYQVDGIYKADQGEPGHRRRGGAIFYSDIPAGLVDVGMIEELISEGRWFKPSDQIPMSRRVVASDPPSDADPVAEDGLPDVSGWTQLASAQDGGFILSSPTGVTGLWRPV